MNSNPTALLYEFNRGVMSRLPSGIHCLKQNLPLTSRFSISLVVSVARRITRWTSMRVQEGADVLHETSACLKFTEYDEVMSRDDT